MLLEAERKEKERAIALERESTKGQPEVCARNAQRAYGGNLLMGCLGLESKERKQSAPKNRERWWIFTSWRPAGASKEQLAELGVRFERLIKTKRISSTF